MLHRGIPVIEQWSAPKGFLGDGAHQHLTEVILRRFPVTMGIVDPVVEGIEAVVKPIRMQQVLYADLLDHAVLGHAVLTVDEFDILA